MPQIIVQHVYHVMKIAGHEMWLEYDLKNEKIELQDQTN